MTPERWERICEVLEEALELPPDERSTFLNGACASDPALRPEVESLLASSHHVRSNFLEALPPPAVVGSLSWNMELELWHRVKEVCQRALELEVSRRAEFIERSCGKR
jgi:hypothetical protein